MGWLDDAEFLFIYQLLTPAEQHAIRQMMLNKSQGINYDVMTGPAFKTTMTDRLKRAGKMTPAERAIVTRYLWKRLTYVVRKTLARKQVAPTRTP